MEIYEIAKTMALTNRDNETLNHDFNKNYHYEDPNKIDMDAVKFMRSKIVTDEYSKYEIIEHLYELATTEEAQKLLTENLLKIRITNSNISLNGYLKQSPSDANPNYNKYKENEKELNKSIDEIGTNYAMVFEMADRQSRLIEKLSDFALRFTAIMKTGDVIEAEKELNKYRQFPVNEYLKPVAIMHDFENIIAIALANNKQVTNSNPEILTEIAKTHGSKLLDIDDLKTKVTLEQPVSSQCNRRN